MNTAANTQRTVAPLRDEAAALMRTFPTLYRNRLMALLAIFDGTEYRWEGGALVRTDKLTRDGRSHLPYSDSDDVNSKHVSLKLMALRENAKADFVHHNAELLAEHVHGGFERDHHISFDGRHFDTMPADVQPEWRDAAIELATGVLAHKPLDTGIYESRYQASRVRDHQRSQEACRLFLERHQLVSISPADREARVAKLRREALALGLTLTDGAP